MRIAKLKRGRACYGAGLAVTPDLRQALSKEAGTEKIESWRRNSSRHSIPKLSLPTSAKAGVLALCQGPDRLFARRARGCGLLCQKGKVKVTAVSEQGKEAVVAMLGWNEFFGLVASPVR